MIVSPLVLRALTRFGFERVFEAVLRRLRDKGCSIEEIIRKVDSYPVSYKLKTELKGRLVGSDQEES